MSQLDLEQLEYETEEGLAEQQPAPGKATLTSRIGRSPRAGQTPGDAIDAVSNGQLQSGLGIDLSRGDGGNGGGAPNARRGLGLGFLGASKGAEMGGDVAGDLVDERPVGRGIDYLAATSPENGTSLKSQQREVAQFDSTGDYYDQRATVEVQPTPAQVATQPGAVTPDPAKKPAATEDAKPPAADLKSQQREVAQFDSTGDFYDQRATVEVQPVQALENAINPDLKKPELALDAINPDLKKPELALDAINPDLKKPELAGDAVIGKPALAGDAVIGKPALAGDAVIGKPALAGDAVIGKPALAGDAVIGKPALAGDAVIGKPALAGDAVIGKPALAGDAVIGATDPALKGKFRGFGGFGDDELLDPYGDEQLYDPGAFDVVAPDEAGRATTLEVRDQGLDGKVAQVTANPQQSKQVLQAVTADATVKKQAINANVEAKTGAVGKVASKGAAGAATKGGKKVTTVSGKGQLAVDKTKGKEVEKKVEKAKSIDELKTRLKANFKTEQEKLKTDLGTQKTELVRLLGLEKKKIDDEVAAQASKLATELAAKNKDLDKQIADKKKAYDKQIADDKKQAEKTCKDEQKKTRDTTTKEVAKIEKSGKSEADKVTQQGHKDAAAAKAKGNQKANACVSQASQRATGVEDAAKKSSITQQGQSQAAQARNAASGEAKQIEAAAKAEADKRKALTTELVAQTKAQGEKAIADLDAKLAASLADIAKKATDGTAKMEAERQKMVGEVKAFEEKTKADNKKKNDDAQFKIHTLQLESEKRIKDLETNGLKGIQTKHDDMLMKLEKGSAGDLEALEKETNKAIEDIQQAVKKTNEDVQKEIKVAQDKAAFEAKKRVEALQADGKKQIDELNKKVAEVQAKIEAIDAETKAGMKKAALDADSALKKQGEDDRNAIVAGADKATTELSKTSEQYASDKAAAEAAEAKKVADEAKAKADEEKATADAEKKKADEATAAEEKKKKDDQAKIDGAAAELFKAMDGMGTDEGAIMRALRGKSPAEIAAIKKAYADTHKGRSLDADLADEMSGTDLKEAKALMSADPVQQAVASLQSATEGWGTDEDKVKATLAGITDPEMKKKIIAEYEKQTGERLQKVLEDEGIGAAEGIKPEDFAKEVAPGAEGPQRPLSDEEKKAANLAVNELEGAMHRWGTDEAGVMGALKGKSPEQIAAMTKAYNERHAPKTLEQTLEDELSGTDLKEAKGLMSGDPVQAAVAQLHSAADGLGTDKDKVLATLKDIKDPEVRKKVQAEYEKQTGDNLGAMLDDELSGMDKDLAKALAGNEKGEVSQGKVAAIEADKAMHGGFLTDISDGMADSIGVDREKMRTVVGTVVLGPVLGGQLGTDVGGTDEEALYKALESCNEKERADLLAEYKLRTKRDLDVDLKGELKGKEKEVTDAILKGDKVGAEAAKMAAAADGVGTDRKALYAALEGKSKEEREAIIARFDETYKGDWPEQKDKNGKVISPFQAMCADELDAMDAKKASQIAEAGKMEDGFALHYAMNEGFLGIGTDDAALKDKLKGKSKEEIAALDLAYRKAKAEADGVVFDPNDKRYPAGALATDVGGETSGRTGHELTQALKGNPTTPEEIAQRAKEDYEFERKDSGWVGDVGMAVLLGPAGYLAAKAMGIDSTDIANGITDTWSDSGKQLDKDYAKLIADIEAAKKARENDPALAGLTGEDRKKKLDALVMGDIKASGQLDFVEGSTKQFGEAKDATADAVGTAVAIAVGALIMVASGGTAAPALVALISGLAGVSAKMIIKGGSMSNEELVQELAQVAAEALAAGFVKLPKVEALISKLSSIAPPGLAAKILKEALEEAVESGAEELFNALLDENLYKGDLADFAAGVGGRVGKAALTGAAAAVVSSGFGDLMPGMNKLGTMGPVGKATNSAINQAVGAAFTTAIDPNTYNGSGADVAMAFGKSMGSAAARGFRDGFSSGEGFKSGPITNTDTHSTDSKHAKATVTTTATTSDSSVTAVTSADVSKGETAVTVTATADTTIVGPNGTSTSDTTTQVIPLDQNKTQPIDADTLADTDPTKATVTPSDGKLGSDPASTTAVDADAATNAKLDAAQQAQAGADPAALDAAVKALPGGQNLEVVADGTPGPLAPNQISASNAKKLISMLQAAMKSPVGKDALKALQDLGVELTMEAGKGSFRQGNRINIDPSMASDANELAGILAHEAHHAKTFDKDVDINADRDGYIAATLKNEAEAQAALFEHYQQTGSIAGAKQQFGAAEYFGAYDKAAKEFKAANPDASPDAVHAHAKAAGTSALASVFGGAIPSTSVDENGQLIPGKPENYAQLYGEFHDQHSPAGLVAQNTGNPIPSTQAAPTNVTPVEGPDPKLVALAQQAYDKYSATLGDAKALLEGMFGDVGEVQGRAKDAVSAANRLQRAIDNFGAKVTDVDSVISNLWDAIGTRLVVGNATPETMAQVVQKLSDAIASGELKITMINNLHGADAKPYLTAAQVKALAAQSAAVTGKEIDTGASKVMPGGFTSVCIYVEYANGVKGEIQIIGEQALAIAAVEHIPYDVGLGKPLVRGIDAKLEPELRAIVGPIEAAIKAVNADPVLKAAYDKYMSEMYAHARNLEMGLDSTPPELPSGLDKSLSVESLQQVYAGIEALKAKQKAMEAENRLGKDVKSPAPVVVIANPEADALPPPTSKTELLAFVIEKYGNVINKYLGAEHTSSNTEFDTLITELEAMEPGSLGKPENKAKAEEVLAAWMKLNGEIEARTGKSEADLRELYNIVEKTDMPRWLTMMEGKTDKEKSELLSDMRREWRVLVRDLMTDEKSKEVLYLRDRALSKHRTGPSLDDLLAKNLKVTGGDLDAAYRKIIESAMRSNTQVNKGITGSETGIKTDTEVKADKTDTKPPEIKSPSPVKTTTPQQSSADLDVLFQQAAEADVVLKAITNQIATETGGTPMFPPGLKGKARTMEKIAADYGGDASRILDLSRASIVYDNFEALQKGLAALEGQVEIVRGKDRFEKPTAGGYRDIVLNVRMPNGHIVELQLHLKQIMEVKQGKGHEIYEKTRAIEAKAQLEGRDLTAQETAEIKALEAESRAAYDAAFASATASADGTAEAGATVTHGDQSITAAAIPGSTFHGKTSRPASPAANIAEGEARLLALAAQAGLANGRKGKPDRDGRYSYEFDGPDGEVVSIRIASVPLSGDEVARSIVNPTKDAHVIQISDKADPKHIERAVAHELAEIMAIRDRAANDKATRVDDDALAKGKPDADAELSPHDMGRLAELDVLARQLAAAQASADNAAVAELTSEIHALIEHLGLRAATEGARARRALVDASATAAVKQLLDAKAKVRTELDPDEAAVVLQIRKDAKKDAKKDQAQQHHERPLRAEHHVSRPEGKSESDLSKEAAEARQKKSDEVVARLRDEAAAQPPGKYPKVKNPQIGGGASVAALSPGQLFVDNRGRWQKDASAAIAQTAHQLGSIKDAGIGDPSQFAEPGARVGLHAINFMQDSIAAQADVINGTASIAVDDQGRMILTIQPLDADGKNAGPPIKVEIEGTPVIATGFPPENVPRGRQSMAENRAALIAGLNALGTAEGDAAKAKLLATPTQDDQGFGAVLDGLPPPQRALLLAGDAKLKGAVAAVDATKAFMAEKARNPSRVVLGQDANLTDLMKDKAAFEAVEHWVIAGVGGTSISAAEIILRANPNAKVTMIGGSITPGLGDNDQFKRVMKDHGPGGDGRFQVVTGHDVPSIETQDDGATYEAGSKIKGDKFVDASTPLDAIDPAEKDSWLVDANDPKMLAAVEKILAGNPKAKVTIVGAALPAMDGPTKQKLGALVEKHGPTGRGKLEVVTGDYASAVAGDGRGGFETTGKVGGDGYVASLGFRGNISPVAQSFIDQADSEGWTKAGELLFDQDGQYIGYRVTIQTPNGPKSIDVTGAASRTVPDFIGKATDVRTGRLNADLLAEASDRDAPPEGGNFDGGYVASATQAARYGRDARARAEANADAADNFELHGNNHKVSLDGSKPDTWSDSVRTFLATELGVDPTLLVVKRLGGGASGAMVFKVKLGDADVGVFKVFKDMAEARNEMAMMNLMASKAMQHFKVVDNKSTSALRVGDTTKPGETNKGAMLMGTAGGRDVSSQIENIPADLGLRAEALAQMENDVKVIARALAEFHGTMASGEMMTPDAKAGAAKYIMDKKIEPHVADFAPDGDAIKVKMLALVEAFKLAPVPATAYHGDANAGNFMVAGETVNVIDVGTMKYSLKNGVGADTGAADLARFEQSLETLHPGKLSAVEADHLKAAFEQAYFAAIGIPAADLQAAKILYAVEVEIAAMRAGKYTKEQSRDRIKALLGI